MEWIKDYWYIALAGLFIAGFYFFGHRTKGQHDNAQGSCCGEDTAQKTKKSGSGCCH
jgi:cbb3-type cytochrome oxidase subunit 3